MNKMKYTLASGLLLCSISIYAETTPNVKTPPPYGDNPNIFVVLGHKTKVAVQNTANKIGAATERGIQKIKPKVENSWDETKTYSAEQAEIAKENTIKAKDKAVEKIINVKDSVIGVNGGTVTIEQGQLSQSNYPAQPSSTAPVVPNTPVSSPNQANSDSSGQITSTSIATPQASSQVATPTQAAPEINTSKDNPVGGADQENDYPH